MGPLMNPRSRAVHVIGTTICSASALANQYRFHLFMKVLALAWSPLNSVGGLPPSLPLLAPPGWPSMCLVHLHQAHLHQVLLQVCLHQILLVVLEFLLCPLGLCQGRRSSAPILGPFLPGSMLQLLMSFAWCMSELQWLSVFPCRDFDYVLKLSSTCAAATVEG